MTAALALAANYNAFANKAKPTPVQIQKEDGSHITVQLHGDEFCHWTTLNGAMFGEKVYSEIKRGMTFGGNSPARSNGASGDRISIGNKKFLVVLAEFDNLEFDLDDPYAYFNDHFNQEGFSRDGATGSVRDYYIENSKGLFTPQYDVWGPVKVSKGYNYYAGSSGTAHVAEMVAEVIGLLKEQYEDLNLADYDNDGNGYVDNIFMIYAGYSAAEGASGHIWPHKYDVRAYKNVSYDGVKLADYACGSELRGTYGSKPSGIGTACHEFGHSIGIPDYYDTDYSGAIGLGEYSVMDSGSYNNDGCTPPFIDGVSRKLMGWMEDSDFEIWIESGEKTIDFIQDNHAYIINTPNEGEFFMIECRKDESWDAPLKHRGYDCPIGMVIYHVDQSQNRVGGITAENHWINWDSYNDINDTPSHELFKFVYSKKYSNGIYGNISSFPGYYNITCWTKSSAIGPTAWNGKWIGVTITDIRVNSDKTVTMYFDRDFKYRCIKLEKSSYSVGDNIPLALQGSNIEGASVVWKWDGQEVSGSVTASATGTHTLVAIINDASGEENITATVKVD